ncbi:hypothetical protein BDR05DRAFT_956254 [Suillus weaverae]|nr:hypothetical protein BDR05DRAFT_956254 [Suillus weaverae]
MMHRRSTPAFVLGLYFVGVTFALYLDIDTPTNNKQLASRSPLVRPRAHPFDDKTHVRRNADVNSIPGQHMAER